MAYFVMASRAFFVSGSRGRIGGTARFFAAVFRRVGMSTIIAPLCLRVQTKDGRCFPPILHYHVPPRIPRQPAPPPKVGCLLRRRTRPRHCWLRKRPTPLSRPRHHP